MKPHQTRLEIDYDGTWVESSTETAGGSESSGDVSYTVVKGDSLWRIARHFYGSGAQYIKIYHANKEIIESTAKTHGKTSSYKNSTAGWWLWPGEVLSIPGVSGGKSQSPAQTDTRKAGAANPSLGEKIAEQATAFTYTDVASGQSDSISVTVQNIGKEWMGALMPKRGASLGAKIILTNWEAEEREDTFDCGTFVLDDISFSGRPLICVLGGVSVPAMEDFKSLPVTKTWERTTIRDIASQITGKAGVSLYYDADEIQIAEIEQSKQTDSAFLYSLCEKYGLAMKVYNRKIVIFDMVRYEEKSPVLTIKETDVNAWSYNTTVDGVYTGVKLNYTDPDAEDTIKVSMGSVGRMYAINTQASGRYDAELQAAAKVNAANRGLQTMEITLRANLKVVASHCVMISGFGNLDGKYYVDKIKHSLGKEYTMQLSIHKVQTAIKATAPVLSAERTGGQSYTVVKGDTLWGISKKFYGSGSKSYIIYDANAELIEATAKTHGKADSQSGHWIWPGETLVIPEG
ncbi:MAG: LysM peptidoglycan-binding domain-containing protein [bacterium]|nr:LysM peptidoglycan-binding domain-containing protein [bacterium]